MGYGSAYVQPSGCLCSAKPSVLMLDGGHFKRRKTCPEQYDSVVKGQINLCVEAGFDVAYVKTLGSDFHTVSGLSRYFSIRTAC